MSAKNTDDHNRWRNVTVAFRMSPEEAEKLTADRSVTIIAGGKRYVDIEMTLRFLPALYAAAQQKGG